MGPLCSFRRCLYLWCLTASLQLCISVLDYFGRCSLVADCCQGRLSCSEPLLVIILGSPLSAFTGFLPAVACSYIPHNPRTYILSALLSLACMPDQVYSQNLTITNNLQATVEATIKPGSPDRYTLHPTTFRLGVGQSTEVKVHLRILKFAQKQKATLQGHRDIFHIKVRKVHSLIPPPCVLPDGEDYGKLQQEHLHPKEPYIMLTAALQHANFSRAQDASSRCAANGQLCKAGHLL